RELEYQLAVIDAGKNHRAGRALGKEAGMNFHNLSIKRELTLITMLTSSAALVLSALSFLFYGLVAFRHLLVQDLRAQAEIIGYNSAGAMEFKDVPAATATLTALTAKED